jgi:hypothetical protein
MRGLLITALLFMLGVTFVSGAYAGEVLGPFSVRNGQADVRVGEQHLLGETYDVITLGDHDVTRQWGKPMLPVTSRSIYIPRGKAVKDVRVLGTVARDLGGTYMVLPAQEEIPLSFVGPARPVAPDAEVYAMDTPYPPAPVRAVHSGSMAGRKILALDIYPLQYVPSEGTVVLNEEITFEIELEDAAEEPLVPRETARVRDMRNAHVSAIVENPGDLLNDFGSGGGTLDPSAAVEYLILCHENHVDEFEALREWKTRKGVPAEIVTVTDAYANYPARDNQESMRECIKDYYLNESTAWVLMTMTAPKAMIRGCFGEVSTPDPEIPCDLYFADMDGDWNDDNDAYWGEVSDDVDLYPDVYVGRSTGNTGIKSALIAEKIMTYEGYRALPTDYQLDFLFMAEYVDAYTNMAVLKNMVDNESVPSRFDPILKLYQDDGSLTHAAAMAALNAGQGLINHAGHGNITILSIGDGGALNTDNMASLTNAPRYSVWYTLACLPGAFDNITGCFAKSFTEADSGGGFFVGNSRNGWYASGSPGYGTGDRYEREFWEAVFGGYYQLGTAFAQHKIARIPYSGGLGTNRWTQFAMNLFGDPEMQIWLDTPQTMTVSHPDSLQPGSHMIAVNVMDGGSPLDGATVCLWKDDEVYQVETTDMSGDAEFTFSVTDSGEIRVTATDQGFLPYAGSIWVGDPLAGVSTDGTVPRVLSLAVTPNPVKGSAAFLYSLPGAEASADAVLEVFDVTGRLVGSVSLDSESLSGSVRWNGRLPGGDGMRPGIYFARLSAGREYEVKKFVVLR